jgi:uncharacterized protein YukE
MTNQHPITLPPAILQKLRSTAPTSGWHRDAWIAEQAAQWGADQELEACCKVICNSATNFSATAHLEAERRSDKLRAARRPKPPSLKEQALNGLEKVESFTLGQLSGVSVFDEYKTHVDNIRRALKALPE